jgi:integrase
VTQLAKVLTQVALDALKPSDKRREIPDGKVSGLQFVLQPSGAASWAFRFRWASKTAKATFGSYPLLGLSAARDLGRKAAADLANGVDPRAKKQAAKAEAREPALDLIENVVETYVVRYARKQTRERSWRETKRHLEREVVEEWRGRRLSSIRRAEVHKLLDKIVDRGAPIVANRVLSAFRRMCNWSLERGLIEVSPCVGIRAPSAESARDRILSDDELLALWRATEAGVYPFAPAIRMLVLTGARLREVGAARWSEIDLAARTWTLPAARTKNGREHQIPLSPTAVAILESLPRFERCDYLFTINAKAPVNDFTNAKKRLDAAMLTELRKERGDGAELTPFVIHDIRRSVATGLAKLGVDLHVIERCLNHVSGTFGGIVSVYQKHKFEDGMRRAFDAWGAHVERIATGAEAENVIEFAARTSS